MIDAPGWEAALVGWALTYLLHSTLLVGAAWLLTLWRPLGGLHSREILWTVALLGGLATSAVAIVGDGGAVAVEVWLREVSVGAGSPGAQPSMRDGVINWEGGALQRGVGAEVELSEGCRATLRALRASGTVDPGAVGAACAPDGGLGLPGVLLLIWLIGALALAAREAGRYRKLAHFRRRLEPAGPRTRRAMGAVMGGLPLPAPRLAASLEVDGPCVLGGGTVVVPPRCEEELSDAELAAVLAHEVAHLLRRDGVRHAVFRWLSVLLWFQPLNRLAAARLGQVAEMACDDWAVSRTARPHDLARSISRVAGWMAVPDEPHPVLVGSQGGSLSARILRILQPRGAARSEGRVAAVLLAGGLLVGATLLPPLHAPGRPSGLYLLRGEEAVTVEAGATPAIPVEEGTLRRVELRVIRRSR